MKFAVFVRGFAREFFECVCKVALRREAEKRTYCESRLVRVSQQAFCFFDFFLQNKVVERDAGLRFELGA